MRNAAENRAVAAGLRALLAEKFPQPAPKAGGVFSVAMSSGAPEVELRRGGVTEVAGSTGSGGLFLETLLKSARQAHAAVALVDGRGGFDPVSLPAGSRFLWVLCKEAAAALKVTDLLLRDGNLPLVLLDLQMNPLAELRRIPASTWYRFQRILEHSAVILVVLTPRPMVSSAVDRFLVRQRWTLRAMRERREDLRLEVEPAPRRFLTGEPEFEAQKRA